MRQALHAVLREEHAHDDSLILDELGLAQGDVRVDVAVVNGSLSGYEIKSAADTLKRLPRQQELYSQVLDQAWLVAPTDKLQAAATLVPQWWGLVEIDDPSLQLTVCRPASLNPQPTPVVIAGLLWHAEVLALLEQHGGVERLRSKPRRVLWAALAERLPLTDLRDAVRTALKARASRWRRVRAPRARGGERSRSVATSPRFQRSLLGPRTLGCSDPQG